MRVHSRGRAAATLLTSSLLLGALTLGATASASAGTGRMASHHTVVITNFMFMPMTLRVAPGAEIKVTNTDWVKHTLTATNGWFTTQSITHDHSKYFRAPTKPGTYHYICNIHQFMSGTIIVK